MSGSLTNKDRQLLRILFERDDPLTAAALAEQLGMSVRTVRTHVQTINRIAGASCVEAGRYGYFLNRDVAGSLLHEDYSTRGTDIPTTSEERVKWLIHRVVRNHQSFNLYDLCEELYISISTMNRELVKVRRRLARFDLELIQKDNAISVSGTEKNRRRLLSELLYKEASINFLDLDTIQQAFPHVDITYIKDCVVEILGTYHYFVNDYSLINVILHIVIVIDQISHNESVPLIGVKSSGSVMRAHEQEMAEVIAKHLEAHFDIEFPPNEIDELALLLVSRASLAGYTEETRESISEFVDSETMRLAEKLIQDFEAFYFISLSHDEFFVRFALHIKNLLIRARNNVFVKNPLAEEIRSSCPVLYESAVISASIIKRETGLAINEDEIGYIAFHLGSTLEVQKQLNTKVKTVLYCPVYYDVDKNLLAFFETNFKNDILLSSVATTERGVACATGAELIVATAPLNTVPEAPVYQIGIVPRESDVERLSAMLSRIRSTRRRKEFRQRVEALVLPKFFEVGVDTTTREEAIHRMADRLKSAKFVDEGYEEELWERERLASTAFGTVAIPHALRPHAYASSISVLIPKHDIDWNGVSVHIVLMLSFSLRERSVFNELFDTLVAILINGTNVKALSEATDYKDFVERLSNMVE